MKCPVMKRPDCANATLVPETRDIAYTYRGVTGTLHDITAEFCPACGEGVFDSKNGDHYASQLRDFQRRVNASYVDPAFITRVRRKLLLDQREAASLFGGGINAFSRYETGKTRPPIALVHLLKLLDRHPDLLAEVRAT